MQRTYALASHLVGFADALLRVRVERIEGRIAWVRTADLREAGTPLVVDLSQLRGFEIQREEDGAVRHRTGLV